MFPSQKETRKRTKSEKKIKVRIKQWLHVYMQYGTISLFSLPLSPQSKVEWVGESTHTVGKKLFYPEVLISGNRVSSLLCVCVIVCVSVCVCVIVCVSVCLCVCV